MTRGAIVRHERYLPEPTDPEIYQFILQELDRLPFTTEKHHIKQEERRINPKRLQRQIKRSFEQQGVQQKAYEVMRLELESRKKERKLLSKAKKEELEQEKYHKKLQKKKEKKKGH
jgi:hypothetical protein